MLYQLVQPLRDNVARTADHAADLVRGCRLAPQLSDQNMGAGEQQVMGVWGARLASQDVVERSAGRWSECSYGFPN